MNAHLDLAFIVLCLCGIVVATIKMSKDNLVIEYIDRSYFIGSILIIHSEYKKLFVKNDSIDLMSYTLTVKINNGSTIWMCICIDYN